MKKRLAGIILVGVLAFTSLAGCGSSKEAAPVAESATTETPMAEDAAAPVTDVAPSDGVSATLAKYQAEGFTIGADLFAPYIYEGTDGNMTGVDYDILTEILTQLGITDIKVAPTAYESVILELNNNNVDCTCDGMYITEARMNQGVYFSDVCYFENDCVLIAEDSTIATEADLVGKKLAVCTGSVAANIGEEMVADGRVGSLDYYTSNDLTFQAVSSGQADAVLCDCFAASPAMGEDSNLSLKYLDSYTPQLTDAVAGFGFRASEKDFVAEFNVVLNEMKEDGRLQAIFDKWNMSSSVFCGVEEGHTVNLAQ
ncbi:MAG: amino acid ABC transporter substrate-binding protein [Lachnospiraceae bacterium]|nr:amino acid ABC transporter substrate-binding protein [Candidatus Colinaster scatohippi]